MNVFRPKVDYKGNFITIGMGIFCASILTSLIT